MKAQYIAYLETICILAYLESLSFSHQIKVHEIGWIKHSSCRENKKKTSTNEIKLLSTSRIEPQEATIYYFEILAQIYETGPALVTKINSNLTVLSRNLHGH